MLTEPEQNIAEALAFLKAARDRLKAAGARRATAKVRAALTSAQGAQRHAQGMAVRVRFAIVPEPLVYQIINPA